MLDIAIMVGVGLLVTFIIVKLVVGYAMATGTTWERLLASAENSAVILKEMVTAMGGMVILWADKAAEFFNMPEVQTFMREHLTPARLGTAITIIAVIGIVARLRTLWKS